MELFTDPDTFLSKHRTFKESIVIVLIAGVILSTISYTTADAYIKVIKDVLVTRGLAANQVEVITSLMYYTTIITPIPVTFISWFVIAGLLYLVSIPFGGKGEFKELLKLTAFSFTPTIILSPINFYIASEISKGVLIYGFEFLKTWNEVRIASIILNIAITIWQYIYWTFAVKNARSLSLRSSAIVSLIPLAILIAISLVGSLSRIY